MFVYKLTDDNMQTRNGFQWELNVSKETSGKGPLCSDAFLHFYHDPLIAFMMSPKHVRGKYKRLFKGVARGMIMNDRYTKGGCTRLTLIKEIPMPVVSISQIVACGILFAQKTWKEKTYTDWANHWLDNIDRTAKYANMISLNRTITVTAYSSARSAYYYDNPIDCHDNNFSFVRGSSAYIIDCIANEETTLEEMTSLINKSLEY